MSDGRDDDDALRSSDARFRLAVETLGEVGFRVRDTGIGMTPEQLARLFTAGPRT
jgi:signal transduction histidine kinase